MKTLKWEIICPVCNQPVSKADIDFSDKLICIDCARKEKKEMWNKNNCNSNKFRGGKLTWDTK